MKKPSIVIGGSYPHGLVDVKQYVGKLVQWFSVDYNLALLVATNLPGKGKIFWVACVIGAVSCSAQHTIYGKSDQSLNEVLNNA